VGLLIANGLFQWGAFWVEINWEEVYLDYLDQVNEGLKT
jgi:hypothetical protein